MLKFTEEKFNSIIQNAVESINPLNGWFPTMQDAELLCNNIKENLEFLIWIVDSNPNRKLTEEQSQTRKYIRTRINESIEIIATSDSKGTKTKEV